MCGDYPAKHSSLFLLSYEFATYTPMAAIKSIPIERNAQILAECIDHGAAHATRGGSPGDDDGVGTEQCQIARERRSEKGAGLQLAYNNVLGRRRDFVHDITGLSIGLAGPRHIFAHAGILPLPAAAVPPVFAEIARGIDYGDTLSAAGIDQRSNDRHPTRSDPLRSFITKPE